MDDMMFENTLTLSAPSIAAWLTLLSLMTRTTSCSSITCYSEFAVVKSVMSMAIKNNWVQTIILTGLISASFA